MFQFICRHTFSNAKLGKLNGFVTFDTFCPKLISMIVYTCKAHVTHTWYPCDIQLKPMWHSCEHIQYACDRITHFTWLHAWKNVEFCHLIPGKFCFWREVFAILRGKLTFLTQFLTIFQGHFAFLPALLDCDVSHTPPVYMQLCVFILYRNKGTEHTQRVWPTHSYVTNLFVFKLLIQHYDCHVFSTM